MTREEAIDILKCGRPFDDNPKADLDDFNLALGVAIKAIKNETTLIDRVLEIIDDADKKAGDKTYIVLDDGSFYSQVKYIKEKMLELKDGEQE